MKTMIKNIQGWNKFTKDLAKDIFPFYQHHESTFDKAGIHGRFHIARAVLFSEFMARFYYNELNAKFIFFPDDNIDFNAIRTAIAFHDSGREDNGIDLWESDSAKMCRNYLISKGYTTEYSTNAGRFIEKFGPWSLNKEIVQDADVLEIMRPICGHDGRDGFLSERLLFLKSNKEYSHIRNGLIEDAWKFIEYTEDNRQLFNEKKNDHLYTMIEILEKNKAEYPILKMLLE